MQRQIFNSDRGLLGNFASRFGAVLAMTGLLLLSACDGGGRTVPVSDQAEPGKDGVPPVLESVTIQPDGIVEAGDSVLIEFVASEALMTPVVHINSVRAEVTGGIKNWKATREMTEFEPEGFVTFSIVYQDISGELGEGISATTNGSAACIGEDCPGEDLGPLEGHWKLDFAGVGLNEGQTDWFSVAASSGDRPCLFDDTYEFGRDGSFRNNLGDETWLEPWQGVDPDACGAPIAPHDGSNKAVFEYDEEAGTLTVTGRGAYLGLAKPNNDGELTDPADAVESITYKVVELIGDSMTLRLNYGGGWWEFRFKRISTSPIVGNWKLDFAGVGLNEGQTDWFSVAASSGDRPCLFDDVYHFGDDGSFSNVLGGETWLEPWQGVDPDACGVPIAPHDGSSAGNWDYDEAGGSVTINGVGSYLGLAKPNNDGELTDPALAPESITYKVVELIGDSMTIRLNYGGGWWEFRFKRVPDAPELRGNWQLDFAGVGLNEGQTDWFSVAASSGDRPCLFDDTYQFGRDGSFRNVQGDETWLEPWQGVDPDACGAPIAPHDGSNKAVFEYDEEAGSLTVTGLGAYLGLAKPNNDGELTDPADAVESITYKVVELIGDSMTLRLNYGGGWWEFRFKRISTSPVVGNWKLDFAGVGLNEGQTDWFSVAASSGDRPCLFDDFYHFGDDGSFNNVLGGETWLEPWQGVDPDACGVPIAPHDGSGTGNWIYDEAGGSVTINGVGSYLGLAKPNNDGELTDPSLAPDAITYKVVELIGDSMKIRLNYGGGWWEFDLVKD